MARVKIETPEKCLKCGRYIPGRYANMKGRCIAYNSLIRRCGSFTTDRIGVIKVLEGLKAKAVGGSLASLEKDLKDLKRVNDLEIKKAYEEDLRRGSRGSNSESDANNKTSMKQKMKDNRALETKQTEADRKAYKEALDKFQEEKGVVLDKLQPNDGLTRSNIDSYTGEEI